MEINLVGNDEEIKKEEIFNDFDINYIPINNLPVSYFPLNNGLLSNELKKINKEILSGGVEFGGGDISVTTLTIDGSKSPYIILVKKNMNCELNLSGTLRKIRLNKGIYTIFFNFNSYNIIQKNNIEIYKEPKGRSANITLDFKDNLNNVKKITSLKKRSIDINPSTSTGISVEPTTDNPNYKLLVYKIPGGSNRLILNKDITCDVLIVGGGGSGGRNDGNEGGGGGGGGAVGMGTITLKAGTYTITIGIGGVNANGGSTIITNGPITLTANGGGRGGDTTGSNGGSGGGGSGHAGNFYGGNATKGTSTGIVSSIIYYGNKGGFGYTQSGGGGGGGAGNSGFDSIDNNKNGANGGEGISSSITGRAIYYGGGGGGASGGEIQNINSAAGVINGKGGLGGGGHGGGDDGKRNNPKNGEDYLGGGGGGSSIIAGGNGGSGIVIFRVKKEDIEEEVDISNELLTSTDTRIINEINNLLEKKMIEFNNEEKPYNYLGILPLVILIIIIWIFIFLFLLKFVHHYFASIYISCYS